MGCPAAQAAADVAGIDLRLRVKVGQAHDVHALEIELPQGALADGDRRQDPGADAALLEHLRHHLGRRAIEFRAPRETEDGRRPRRWADGQRSVDSSSLGSSEEAFSRTWSSTSRTTQIAVSATSRR